MSNEQCRKQFQEVFAERQVALNKFKARKEAFLLAKEQITEDIEEARNIWENTLELLPKQEFN